MKELVKLPDRLNGIISEEVYQNARLYELDKNAYSNIHDLYSTIINTVLVYLIVFFFIYIYYYCKL